ncbi:MAG: hypothetical protein A2857_00805 [Candidatus Levybacteria bacterium RIFCSPHIGHO2_01_FULL_36_15]|nr:MAG: hypothetical protein A2857_00805 [Candidatus Levybacteria bacterium RIFCSPHIGHO2_01_FULL_36_15]OGH37282.1 MAG: hypothetical protein A2905_01095 [Candidatus Levybacteria bacterium RIFCSPLOWO2_01_FULL_36_10]
MDKKFVSRAGLKLEHALKFFNISVRSKVCADLGVSTGGFTDCLLQNGAKKVYAVDTAYGVLEWKIRHDPRVVTMEKTNALYLTLPLVMDFISIDVGWTQQKLIVPRAVELLKNNGDIVSLLKPHYEADKSWRRKGTLLAEFIPKTIDKVKNDLSNLDLEIQGITQSPIIGSKGGNIEYLMWIRKI